MKNITIAGNIGRDAVTRTTGSGDKVTGWPVAVEERGPDGKRTLWFDVALWGKRGESLSQYLTKGSRVAVSGDLSTREHDGKTYLTVRADQVTLLGGGSDRAIAPGNDNAGGNYADQLSDDIPF
ncbi:single-stranded DNA-binding protein [Camelimonas abortus]|uniref:Single-stranded DNA-binding protein n=1 Tax=Camelimonas abortus TaxID=1017184 RepID=A0ABV7LH45_9HYPH